MKGTPGCRIRAREQRLAGPRARARSAGARFAGARACIAVGVLALPLWWHLVSTPVQALPEFSVESARSCSTCHVYPHHWENPRTAERKCTLSCGGCHVSPTGGGLRHEAGLFYGRHYLSLLDRRTHETGSPLGDPPGPGDPARFAGIVPSPRVQVGADLRTLAFFPTGGGRESALFPMQMDVHLAIRPYSPREQNAGRLTLVVTGGAEGSRTEAYDGIADRAFLKEWWALLHDLPNQIYARAGRFQPAYGWRLDDHTAYVRQSLSFDQERQVTGVELGLNPNYAFGHVSVFANERAGTAPVPTGGWGTAAQIGYRDLAWQAGASFMYESRDDADEVWAGGIWALNLFRATHPWKGLDLLPVTYIGELDVRRTHPNGGDRSRTGIAALHQLTWHPIPELRVTGRYDWQDFDVDVRDDHRSRYVLAVVLNPLRYLELMFQYRRNAGPDLGNDEIVVASHVWY